MGGKPGWCPDEEQGESLPTPLAYFARRSLKGGKRNDGANGPRKRESVYMGGKPSGAHVLASVGQRSGEEHWGISGKKAGSDTPLYRLQSIDERPSRKIERVNQDRKSGRSQS